jgi:hypothetical protein
LRVSLENAVSVEALDADLSTVSAAADRLIRVTRPEPLPVPLYHLDLQGNYDVKMDERVLHNKGFARYE